MAEGSLKNPKSASGIELKEVYTSRDLGSFDERSMLGRPGDYPFTRGIEAGLYRKAPWIIGQYAGFGSVEQTNARFKYLFEQGQTGLSVALDLPTQMGYDSDDPLAGDEVGKVGVPVCSLKDIEVLFDGIPLQKIRQVAVIANAVAPVVAAFFIALAESKGMDPNSFSVRLQNDVLKEYFARGTYFLPPRHGLKLGCDVIEYFTRHLPRWVPINVCGYHIRESGGTAIQELAFTFANAIAYIDNTIKRGIGIDSFAPSMRAFFSSGMDFFEEVAKFRAARRIWAKIMEGRYKAADSRSKTLGIIAYTAGSALTVQQPYNNITRVTLEGFAAVCGGVQWLLTSSMDEAMALPSEQAVKIALRTQQIIAEETGVTHVDDPLGGSYYVEYLVNEMEKRVDSYLEKIQEMGGAVKAIENRFYHNELAESAYLHQKEIENNQRVIVGVNKYQGEETEDVELLSFDTASRDQQIRRLKALRAERSNIGWQQALDNVGRAAEKQENILPSLVEAVKCYATLGEITASLKKLYGVYH